MNTESDVPGTTAGVHEVKGGGAPQEGTKQPSAPQSVAEFRTDAGSPGASEDIPHDLLHAFERNYHSHERAWRRLAVGAACVAGAVIAGWLLFSVRMPQTVSTATKPAGPPSPSVPAARQQAAPMTATPKQATAPAPASPEQAAANATLPSFIPVAGRDKSFAARKPGWERYAGASAEFRIFRSKGRMKALQVLAGRGHAISEAFFKTVLKEMTGGSRSVVASSVQKDGFLIQRGAAGRNAGLLVYRKKGTGEIRAFVVSFD